MRHILLVLAMLVAFPSFAQNGKKQITMDDLWKNNTFSMKSVPGFNAMKDGLRYSKLERAGKHQNISIYSLETGAWLETVFNTQEATVDGKRLRVSSYEFSEDEKMLLIKTERESIYRRSALYRTYVYDIAKKEINIIDEDKVLHASFSADGSRVAFVKDNNLFYRDLKSKETKAVTRDGKWNYIINGNCDWVYEEEFGFTQAFQWSPDGKYIAYYRFDETNVPEYTLPVYSGLYPENYTYKYPKAGEPNSIVEIRIHSIAEGSNVTVNVGNETDQYIPRIKWSNNPSQLCVYRLNRLQNKLDLLLADARSGVSETIYSETNKYYIDINDNLVFLPDGQSFVFTSERDKYVHLYKWDWKNRDLKELTPGKFDIDNIVGVMLSAKLFITLLQKIHH